MRIRPREVPQWRLDDIARLLGEAQVEGTATFSGIAMTSRTVQPGDLFAALPGTRLHGAGFAAEAMAAGAVAVLTDSDGNALLPAGTPRVIIDSPRSRLAELATALYRQPSNAFLTIGITGTQGKTTTSRLAEAAIGIEQSAVIGTNGTRIAGQSAVSSLTTPEAADLQALFAVMREESIRACVMEVSSHALVQGRVDGFVFDLAVFTNLARDHLDFHRDMEDYFAAKARLFEPDHARQALINIDDPWGRRLADATAIDVQTWSIEGRDAHWRAVDIRADERGSTATIIDPNGSTLDVRVPMPGAFNVSNALAAHAAAVVAGVDPADSAARLGDAAGVPGRLERVDAGQAATVVVDYAHKPEALAAVLTALRPTTRGRLIAVIGAGGDRDRGKRPLMGEAASRLADLVIVTDDNPRSEVPAAIRAEVLAGVISGVEVEEIGDRRAAIARALGVANAGDTVLIAGKGHETGQEVAGVIHAFDDRMVVRELVEESR